jgi:hypothetical protein
MITQNIILDELVSLLNESESSAEEKNLNKLKGLVEKVNGTLRKIYGPQELLLNLKMRLESRLLIINKKILILDKARQAQAIEEEYGKVRAIIIEMINIL